MIILKKLSTVTAGIACAAVTNLGSISPAVAITLNIDGGRFTDGTTFTGSFTVDLNTAPYSFSSFDITTITGTSSNTGDVIPGARYTSPSTSSNIDEAYGGPDGPYTQFTFVDNDGGSGNFLTLLVEGLDFSSPGQPILSGSFEQNSSVFTNVRGVTAGSLVEATPVPFELCPGLGILALGTCGAIEQFRRKMRSRKLTVSTFAPK